MKSLHSFITLIGNSVAKPSFYPTILRYSLWSSVRYFFFLCVLLGILHTVGIFMVIIPGMQQFWDLVKSPQFYPSGLEIQVQDGAIETNTETPVQIPFTQPEEELDWFLVIDTTAQTEDIEEYDSLMLITQNQLIWRDANQQRIEYSLENLQNVTITQESFATTVERVDPWVQIGIPVFATLLFILLILWLFVSNGVMVLMYTVIPFVISRVFKSPLSIPKSIQVSIHAYTIIIMMLGFLGGLIPGIFILMISVTIYSTFIIFVLQHLKKNA